MQCNGSLGSPIHGRLHLLLRCAHVLKCGAVPLILLLLDCQELRADLERQRRVLQNAAIIQAKDQEERARVSAAFVPAGVEDPHPPTSQGIRTREQDSTLSPSDVLEAPPPASHTHDVKQASQPPHSPGLPPIGKDKDWQPESWTPQATRRRGG